LSQFKKTRIETLMSRYFNIEEIIAEDEKSPVVWRNDAPGVAWLDSSLVGRDVPKNTRMELPLWLADEMKNLGLVEVQLPEAYSRKSRDNIKADAVSAKLRELSPHFYSVGLRLGPLLKVNGESKALSKDIHDILADRAARILQRARTGMDVSRYRDLLTDLEQQIFNASYSFTTSKLAWRREEAGMMRPPAETIQGGGQVSAQVLSAEGAAIAAATMPLSRGQKRNRSLLATTE